MGMFLLLGIGAMERSSMRSVRPNSPALSEMRWPMLQMA
tara:strand:+ start:174 stop:290 length:117 start_codon:yes stop_codon:yes gene_type:complete